MELLSEQNKLELSNTLQDDWHAAAGGGEASELVTYENILFPKCHYSACTALSCTERGHCKVVRFLVPGRPEFEACL